MKISVAFVLPVLLFAFIASSSGQIPPDSARACPVAVRWTNHPGMWTSTRLPLSPNRFSVITGFRCVLAWDNATNLNEAAMK
ncbi:MAG TPA: hypothetical protein VNV43_14555 [Candidatus Acidoferrales bacterium]|jgi:hypothetical protein|nr:hypothetical protein [Candidatus Acidoferrales bacterium]